MGDQFRAASRPAALTRRHFIKLGALSAVGLSLPAKAIAGIGVRFAAVRSLRFYNIHTGESLERTYWEKGRYVPEALGEIWHLLRDFRTNEVKPIEPSLLDLLHTLAIRLDSGEPYHVISGYRSPATNAMLAERSEGVAHHSLHIDGKAIDVSLPGRDLRTLHDAAVSMGGGGVGYYPRSGFVHVDVGRVRYW